MTAVSRNPLSDFRISAIGAAGIAIAGTATASGVQTTPPSNNNATRLVVQDITAALASGTAFHPALPIYLIDGTQGGTSTNIVWQAVLAGIANGYSSIAQNSLNIQCMSGQATLAFGTAISTQAIASIAFGGYYTGGYNN